MCSDLQLAYQREEVRLSSTEHGEHALGYGGVLVVGAEPIDERMLVGHALFTLSV
jgi:hypothetical protein